MSSVTDGWTPKLSAQQVEILKLTARGYDNRAISELMILSREWVYTLMRQAREELGAATDAGAVLVGIQQGLIGMPGVEEIWEAGLRN